MTKREILFKGKKIDNGEWVEGYYLSDNRPDGSHFIVCYCKYEEKTYEIDPSTICQYTGLTDMNGQKIWENDIARIVDYDGIEHIYQIVWDASELDFKATNGKDDYKSNFQYITRCEEIEIIGNVFDNPELQPID